ncbi:MAG: hypothetical protein CVV06_08150 [Gammaproteobacteria bacterium HGW-Gammaproteobacteria-10]|nr:MAG: hypothetical protein CVV06_08150 [Gammaproteobacteria bacterium HGW-Gammaproteobacteria-10]
MANYNTQFKLTVNDIDLIEQAVRQQISHLSVPGDTDRIADGDTNYRKIRELMSLLGSLHNQKIFYSQVHHRPGMPLG